MRHKFLKIMMLITLVFIFGCTSPTKVKTSQTNEFESELKSQFKEIKKLNIQYSPTQIQIMFGMRSGIDPKRSEQIFMKTKEFVQSTPFRDSVIQDRYFKKYPQKDGWNYPNISMSFDVNSDGEFDYEYTSFTQENSDYANWTYWDYKNTPIPVP